MKKRRWIVFLLLIILGALYYFVVDQRLPIINGYAAKNLCSCHFGANRSETNIKNYDMDFSPINLVSTKINKKEKTVESSIFGLKKQVAKFKPGIGCVLLEGEDDYNIKYPAMDDSTFVEFEFGLATKGLLSQIDTNQLDYAMELAFHEDYKTRTSLLIFKNRVIYEKYADGLDKNTPQLGWSMTKSIVNALIGILVFDGKLSLEDNNLFTEWEQDKRSNISIHHLLQMTSGLEWEEDYTKISDVTKMLYKNENIEELTIDQALAHKPGTEWYYASGTTNLLCSIIKNKLSNQEEYLSFPRKALFEKIGMKSAFIETDESGNFIGSSFGFATARDWAKLGRLYLHDGWFNGKQILPEGWVDYSTQAAMGKINNYGAQIWLNKNKEAYPDLPEDLFSFNGFQGQKVVVIPSRDLIYVRLGHSKSFDLNEVLSNALKALPDE